MRRTDLIVAYASFFAATGFVSAIIAGAL